MESIRFDVERARRETPGCAQILHFNNAGASLMPAPVLDAVVDYLRLEARLGGYEAADRCEERLEGIYDGAAALLGCARDEAAFVENATRAWDMAFYSLPFRAGDRILTGMAEYGSNYIAFLQVARRTGARIEVIPDDPSGQISVDALRERLDERVKLIAVTHVPTNGGLVNPAADIGRVARQAGVPFLLDACQSVGQMPVNVRDIGCDMLSVTGRKYLRGPRGTGLLFVRRGMIERLEPPFLDLHAAAWTARDRFEIRGDARRFENWETNCAGKIGLGVAVNYAMGWGLEAIRQRITSLAGRLREGLGRLPRVAVRDLGRVKCGIVSFTMEGLAPSRIQTKLAEDGIHVRVSSAGATRLDMERRGVEEIVRASVHYYNTEEEVDRFCAALARLTGAASTGES